MLDSEVRPIELEQGIDMPTLHMIDDDKELCKMLGEYFAAQQMKFSYSCDGRSGLAAVMDKRPDIVILDIMIPEITAREVLSAIRNAPAVSATPVIMLTAMGEDSAYICGLDEDADSYLPKPFNMRELISRIKAVHHRFRLRKANPHTALSSAEADSKSEITAWISSRNG